MALGQVLIDAVTYALAGAAIEPVIEPVKGIASRAIGAGRTFANRVAAAHAGVPAAPVDQLNTGRSWWKSVTREVARWGSPDAWQKGVFDPVGEWITEHPCESTKMAAFLAFGLGNPTSALAPCPAPQAAAQMQRAKYIRYALFGAVGLAAVLLITRKKRGG